MSPWAQERGPPTADALYPGLGLSGPRQPPAWENPGLLPGAAALPGRAGEGIPGICPETAVASLGRIGPYMGSASAASAGKAPARAAVRGRACALRFSSQASCLQVRGDWAASSPWAFQPPGSGDVRRVRGLGPRANLGKAWAELARGSQNEPQTAVEWRQPATPLPPPSRFRKKDNRVNKEPFFFYLNRFNKKSEQTHTHTQTHLKINSLGTKCVFLLHSMV